MYELECAVQNYAWGKIGNESLVAQLGKSGNEKLNIDINKPYAELWMGTHPNGPSKLKKENRTLDQLIQQTPDLLGDNVVKNFGNRLPFLFKILSVNQALSIQAHPDKVLAEHLHKTRPDLYKDPNHKPELAIALTQFEGLSGFRPLDEIKNNIKNIPEFHAVIGEKPAAALLNSTNENYESALKECFHSVMTCPANKVQEQLNLLLARVQNLTDVCSRTGVNACTLETIASKYPGDVGCFILYFLNYIILKPGEAMFLGPNVPHAYLKGDCVECMACSDNVVRAGLTPKFKDVETLCSMLRYVCEPIRVRLCEPIEEDKNTRTFNPVVSDFAVSKIQVPKDESYSLIKRSTSSIIIVISGKAQCRDGINLDVGKVFFMPAETDVVLQVQSDLLLFQAFTNI